MNVKGKERRSNQILISKLVLALLIIVFSVQRAYPGATVVYKEARPKKHLAETEKDQAKTDSDKKGVYVYDPVGKTDPFVPFVTTGGKKHRKDLARPKKVPKLEALLMKLKEAKTELQRIDMSELTLTAIVKREGEPLAMVSDPKGRGYLLEKGTFIGTNGGVVHEIVSEEKETAFGMESIRKVIVKEPYVNRQGNLDYNFIEREMKKTVH
ncbi:MAG: pilus assembly protein PilP [Thermodesulfobacteriota bacterium]|nr:pilus assembly protein PilP [Thermodesulfobacteriota bacterium]